MLGKPQDKARAHTGSAGLPSSSAGRNNFREPTTKEASAWGITFAKHAVDIMRGLGIPKKSSTECFRNFTPYPSHQDNGLNHKVNV